MKVKPNHVYIYHPNLLDRTDARTNLQEGEQVRVVNLPGCPRANTMHHAHVQRLGGTFAGLVHTNSLHTLADYTAYLRARITQMESAQEK